MCFHTKVSSCSGYQSQSVTRASGRSPHNSLAVQSLDQLMGTLTRDTKVLRTVVLFLLNFLSRSRKWSNAQIQNINVIIQYITVHYYKGGSKIWKQCVRIFIAVLLQKDPLVNFKKFVFGVAITIFIVRVFLLAISFDKTLNSVACFQNALIIWSIEFRVWLYGLS